MIARVLVDTGPLVAMASKRDAHYAACTNQLREIAPPLLTCWPVLTEAAWLLRRYPAAIIRLLASFESGFLSLLPLEERSLPWISGFLRRYTQAQLADACLVYLAEREGIGTIFTLDRRDFSVYRLSRQRALTLVP